MPRIVTIVKAHPYQTEGNPQYRMTIPSQVRDLFNWSGEMTFELEAVSGKIVLRTIE